MTKAEMLSLHERLSDELQSVLRLNRSHPLVSSRMAQLRHALAFWRRQLVAPLWAGTPAEALRQLRAARARRCEAQRRVGARITYVPEWRLRQNLEFAEYAADLWFWRVRSAKQAEPPKPLTKPESYAARAAVREIKRKRKADKVLLDQSRARV